MKLKPYPKYKDSGIQWIGEIPEGWEVRKLKFFTNEGKDKQKNVNDTKYIGLENIESWTGKIIGFRKSEDIEGDALKFKKNDVLFGKLRPYLAKVANPQEEGICSSELIVYIPLAQVDSKFLYYRLLSKSFVDLVDSLTYGAKMPRADPTTLSNIKMQLPPKQEQIQIVHFLDKKTLQIDITIQKDKQLIELLREKKTALINHVVTKGLDPNAKIKNSGIDWIGDIPEGWNVKKIKYTTLVKISNVDKKTKPNEPEVLLCNYTDVYNNEFITSKINFMKNTASIEQISKLALKKGDVIITKDSETAEDIAVPALVDENLNNVVCGYHLALIRPNKKILLGGFLLRLFQSKKINDQFYVWANGVTRFGISTYPIKSSYIIIPPKPEQQKIIEYLNNITSKIDETIQKIEKKIELLEEYKKSLIHYVITGKNDVRSVAA